MVSQNLNLQADMPQNLFMDEIPFISIIIPCRNEEKFIASCLDSIIASDFPKEQLEVLVVDGMSEDGTRSVLDKYTASHAFIKVLENPKRVTPSAFNIGIRQGRGELIMIMSAHATYEKYAISKCVASSKQYDAENVGGIWKIYPRNDTLSNRAIVCALSHSFGVGNALYRTISETNAEPIWVDTAAYGCYKRAVFEKIGLFNEQLIRGQDIEFNLRLRKVGGKTLLVPNMVINYYARTDFLSFWNHNFRNGLWVIMPFLYSDIMPVSWRHLVPLLFVTSLIGSGVIGLTVMPLFWLFLIITAAYILANLIASFQIALHEQDYRYMAVMPFVFGMLHIGYGTGSLWGVIKLIGKPIFWNKLLGLRVIHKRPF
jgi:GT2 family glycosyltransferase